MLRLSITAYDVEVTGLTKERITEMRQIILNGPC